MKGLIIKDVRPWGLESRDLYLSDGKIAKVDQEFTDPLGVEYFDGKNAIVLPAFTDAHVHLDSTRIGLPFRPNSVKGKGLWNSIENDRYNWRSAELPVADRASLTLGKAISFGMTRARAYAQVDADCMLERFDGVMAARAEHFDRSVVQVVAFPQAGLLLEDGVPALIEEAIRQGAEIVGGIDPCALDCDPKRHLDLVFGIADKHGVEVDIHLHEHGELGLFTAREIIKRSRALGMKGKVTIAHAFFLSDISCSILGDVLDDLADLDIAVTTVAPGERPALPLFEMMDRGIRVGLGQDGQRDYWSPYGNTDMLDRTWQLAFTNNLRQDPLIERAIETATLGGARVCDPSAQFGNGRGFDIGDPADFVLVPGETPTSCVMDKPGGRTVIHAGKIVAKEGALVS